MKKWFMVLIIGLIACNLAQAKPIKNSEQAIEMVMQSLQKHHLTELKSECLMFDASENQTDYLIDIHENHTKKCGGDPETAPRLMSYQINKKSGVMCTDSIEWAKRLNAESPYDFSCRIIK